MKIIKYMICLSLLFTSMTGCSNSSNTSTSVTPINTSVTQTNTANNYSINYVIEPCLTETGPEFVDGIMLIGIGNDENKKYGFIDNMGNIIAQPIYDYTYYTAYVSIGKNSGFSEDLACLCKNGKLM